MIFYAIFSDGVDETNIEQAREVVGKLQEKDLENCYICPDLAFYHLERCEICKDDKTEIRLDVLQNCEKLIIIGEKNEKIQNEIDFAKLLKLEVVRLGENGDLQPFTE